MIRPVIHKLPASCISYDSDEEKEEQPKQQEKVRVVQQHQPTTVERVTTAATTAATNTVVSAAVKGIGWGLLMLFAVVFRPGGATRVTSSKIEDDPAFWDGQM
jgi:hypothetical protein